MSIKATLQTKGWKEILQIIEEEKIKMCDCRNLDHSSLEQMGAEAMARSEAVCLIDEVLKRIKTASQDIKTKPLTYK